MDKKIDTGIVQRGKSYRFTVYMGYDKEGKQIRKTTTFTPPEGTPEKKAIKMAKEEYINFKHKCTGLGNYNANMRFCDLTEQYFKVYAPNRLKPITAYNYNNLINYHFMDYFGNKKLKDITTGMLTEFFNTHKAAGKDGNLKPLAPATSKKLYTIMQSILSFATQQGYININPAKGVILPTKNIKAEEKRKYMTEEELQRFLNMLDGYSEFNTMIKVLLYTGMRSGEMLGLQWQDIDFDNNIITIKHTLTDVGGNHFLTTPKTKTSQRYIAMGTTVRELLLEHKTHHQELIQAIPNFPHPEMVFTSERGNYKDRSSLNTSFKRFLNGSGLEFLTLHSLRHCNATLLINNGVDLKIVSEHLGHSDIGITANIYADVLASTKRKTADLIETVISTK